MSQIPPNSGTPENPSSENSTAPGSAPTPGVPLEYAKPSNAYAGPPPDKEAITMGMLCHLLAIFTQFLGPLIIWLIKKDSSPFVDDQGKESLNFQIFTLIVTLLCFIGLCVAPFLIAAVQIARLVFCIIATVKANEGIAYRYPINFRLIK